jgi:hypothetical protein
MMGKGDAESEEPDASGPAPPVASEGLPDRDCIEQREQNGGTSGHVDAAATTEMVSASVFAKGDRCAVTIWPHIQRTLFATSRRLSAILYRRLSARQDGAQQWASKLRNAFL